MKAKLRFLLKFFGCSLSLFVIGHYFFQSYASALMNFVDVQDPRYHLPANIQQYFLTTPMIMIAFISLVLSTPRMPVMKKAGLISIGIVVLYFVDFFFIQYLKGAPPITDDSIAPEVYFCMKWLLPFMVWILPNYAQLGEFFTPEDEAVSQSN